MLTFFQTEDNEPEIMILQNADSSQPDQGTRFVIKNIEHAALAAQLAKNFGNDEFATPEPFDELLFLAAHHDHGWQSLDEDPPVNDKDGLPFNLVDTPIEHIILTSKASPDFNEKHSPFCGLISSMHTYGLYNGRYGLSDAINMDWVPESSRADVDLMLAGETERQSRLKKELENSSLNDEELIFTAYKFLQFVDACALYFNMNAAGQRGNARFQNVPKSPGEDVEIEVTEDLSGRYRFKPYPFRREKLELYFEGRYMQPGDLKQGSGKAMKSKVTRRQTMEIVAN